MLAIKSDSYCWACDKEIRTLLEIVNDRLLINCIPCNNCMKEYIDTIEELEERMIELQETRR
jgi:hypothetical protein